MEPCLFLVQQHPIETRARAQKGVYHFLELTQRANPNAKIPQVEVVDFKDFVGRQEAKVILRHLS